MDTVRSSKRFLAVLSVCACIAAGWFSDLPLFAHPALLPVVLGVRLASCLICLYTVSEIHHRRRMVVAAAPVWWYSVRVHRSPLPDTEALAAAASPLASTLPVTLTVYVLCRGVAAACALVPGATSHVPGVCAHQAVPPLGTLLHTDRPCTHVLFCVHIPACIRMYLGIIHAIDLIMPACGGVVASATA